MKPALGDEGGLFRVWFAKRFCVDKPVFCAQCRSDFMVPLCSSERPGIQLEDFMISELSGFWVVVPIRSDNPGTRLASV